MRAETEKVICQEVVFEKGFFFLFSYFFFFEFSVQALSMEVNHTKLKHLTSEDLSSHHGFYCTCEIILSFWH